MMALADDVAVQGPHESDPDAPDRVFDSGCHQAFRRPWHACFMVRSHGRQSTPSSALEVNHARVALLTIGELARRTGVATSALRYYEEVGLLPPPARVSGQRRYPASAARLVAAILLYSDAGFTIAEQKTLAVADAKPDDRRQLMQSKLEELDAHIARAQAARAAISHGLDCPHEDITQCPNFNAGLTARLAGRSLAESHEQLHGRPAS
jgi:DNA-binding transcriptional MerR regulator